MSRTVLSSVTILFFVYKNRSNVPLMKSYDNQQIVFQFCEFGANKIVAGVKFCQNLY